MTQQYHKDWLVHVSLPLLPHPLSLSNTHTLFLSSASSSSVALVQQWSSFIAGVDHVPPTEVEVETGYVPL